MNRVTERLYQYYRKKYIKYRDKILSEKERDFDTYTIEHNETYICGIDNGTCYKETCTKGFNKYCCMYLKGIYKQGGK